MDPSEKKQLKARWRAQQREAALAALPLSPSELEVLFDMLDVKLPQQGCDHSRRLTHEWLTSRGHDVERVFGWLDTQGAFCDCEILANVEERVNEANKA